MDPVVLLLVLLHLAVTLPLALILNVWIDEAYSLHTTAGSLGDTFLKAIGFEQQAPAYFLLLDLWRRVSPTPFFARLLSVVCIAATLLVAATISRRVFPGWSPAWLVGFLAFNPVLVWAAVEIRPYPLAILAAALVLAAYFATTAETGVAPRGNQVLLMMAAVLALYTQYYLGILLAALAVGLLVTGRTRALARYATAMAGAFLLCLPIAIWLPGQLGSLRGISTDSLNLREAAGFGINAVSVALLPGYELLDRATSASMHQLALWGARIVFVLAAATLLAVSGGLGRLFRNQRVMSMWATFLTCAAAFPAVAFVTGSGFMAQRRYWSYLALLGGVVLMSIAWATGHRKVLGVVLGLTIAFNVVVLIDVYSPLAKDGDSKRVARFLEDHERPHEPILVFPNDLALPLRMYYSGVNRILPVPREVSLEIYDPRNTAIRSEDELARFLDGIDPGPSGGLWLVRQDVTGYRGVPYRLDLLDAAVAARYAPDLEKGFFEKVTVQHLMHRDGRRHLERRDPVPGRPSTAQG